MKLGLPVLELFDVYILWIFPQAKIVTDDIARNTIDRVE